VNGYVKMVVGDLETFSQLAIRPNPTTRQHDVWDGCNSFSLYMVEFSIRFFARGLSTSLLQQKNANIH